MTTANPFSIIIEVPSGDLMNGARIIRKMGWSGAGVEFPRSEFANIKDRDELRLPGVYVLWDQEPEPPQVYVGLADNLSKRIGSHAHGTIAKGFWTHAVVFSGGLNEAHARYIEASLMELAKRANRCALQNLQTTQKPTLLTYDVNAAEGFLHNMLECLLIIGIRFFHEPPGFPDVRPAPGTVQPPGSPDDPYPTGVVRLAIRNPNNGTDAAGYSGSEFVVLAGSKASRVEHDTIRPHIADQRQHLLRSGVLEDNGETLVFTQNYAFNSPSRAAGVCLGRNASGNAEWRDHAGVPLGELM